ncbi:hypothetical protein [Georgenia sp. SUBG003]|uniref:hypothetical protein n=1 Tax=Georgenia sp. SUBG003 TaxID=1497974 RepID=UPI003AB4E7A2
MVLLFVAVSLVYILAATQLDPRMLYEQRNPPVDPASIENALRSYNLSDQVPLLERYWTWLSGVVTQWDWGRTPFGASVNEEIGTRMFVSLRLVAAGSLLGIVLGVALGAWMAVRQYRMSDRVTTLASLIIISTPTVVIAPAGCATLLDSLTPYGRPLPRPLTPTARNYSQTSLVPKTRTRGSARVGNDRQITRAPLDWRPPCRAGGAPMTDTETDLCPPATDGGGAGVHSSTKPGGAAQTEGFQSQIYKAISVQRPVVIEYLKSLRRDKPDASATEISQIRGR